MELLIVSAKRSESIVQKGFRTFFLFFFIIIKGWDYYSVKKTLSGQDPNVLQMLSQIIPSKKMFFKQYFARKCRNCFEVVKCLII